ncbi:hypothetical protein GCM10011491_38690 [Brucella endophytica]|uniref:Histidine ammonia-lyase n=1 Tax=Brucella endophytica TaxID=1963359 RepID=A0A916SM42_9HYPH|nr:hypothetical protein GCM10011491_38690 [Brucella endophytica]
MTVTIETVLIWRDVARVGDGEALALSEAAWDRVAHANRIVERIVETGIRAYGVNTGVGALSDTVVDRASQSQLSRNIVLSHACGVGEPLPLVKCGPSSPPKSPISHMAIPACDRRLSVICWLSSRTIPFPTYQ